MNLNYNYQIIIKYNNGLVGFLCCFLYSNDAREMWKIYTEKYTYEHCTLQLLQWNNKVLEEKKFN